MSVSANQPRMVPPSKSLSGLQTFMGSQRKFAIAKQIVILIVMGLGAVVMIIPFVWMLGTSLSRNANVAMPRVPQLIPSDLSLFNYKVAVTNLPILKYYVNSIIVTGATTVGYVFLSALTGYVFAKGRFPGKTFFFLLLLTSFMLPFEIKVIPLYLLMKSLHLSDSLLSLILPFLAGGFGMFLMRQYISTIPDDLIDAARVDGANEFIIFWNVVLPLCGPALAALAVITTLGRWNDVFWPLLIISDRNLYTVTLGLALASRSQGIYTGVALANAALTTIPIIILYVFLQRYIIKGILMGAVKG
jgi:multiple sugar transport system permease protein